MKKNSIILLLLLVQSILNFCVAQNDMKKNTIFTQLGGNGLILSLNYEMQLLKKPNLRAHAGFGFYGKEKQFLTIPIGFKYLLSLKKRSYLDCGIGLTYTRAEALYNVCVKWGPDYKFNQPHYIVVPSLTYRYLTNKNYMLQFGFTPIITNIGFIPLIGFSFGFQF